LKGLKLMISLHRENRALCMQLPLWCDPSTVILRYRWRFRKRQVCVTRARVLDYIMAATEPLDTQQIADALSTPDALIPERSVRAACAWLVLSGFLEKSTKPIIRRQENGQPYKVWLYVWTGKNSPIREVRRNAEERAVQEWGNNTAGVYLQNLFLRMK
jgi:hypothetical protein